MENSKVTIALSAAITLILFLFFCSIKIIGVGEVGVETLFGKYTGNTVSPGFHIFNPFSRVHTFNVRTQHVKEDSIIPTQEMLTMELKTSVNFHLLPSKAAEVYSTVGKNYYETLVEPNIRASIREVTGGYKAQDFFSKNRNSISSAILKNLEDRLGSRGFKVEKVMLKEILPPRSLQAAIEKKQTQEQEAEAMRFRLEKEKLEAERKKIEAMGIQQFQEIVKKGIDENLLLWKAIEATQELAKSSNSKVIIIGSSKNGLPVILGGSK